MNIQNELPSTYVVQDACMNCKFVYHDEWAYDAYYCRYDSTKYARKNALKRQVSSAGYCEEFIGK